MHRINSSNQRRKQLQFYVVFVDQPVNNNWSTYDSIWKIAASQGDN